MELFDYLALYADSDYYPFHMPGHKRNPESGLPVGIYQYDITEIDGFDNLHQPESIIKDAEQRAAGLYDSEETYFLVNGSTAGILSAVSAVSKRAGKLIIARNCHKAVYHAAFLNRMELHYVYPHIHGDYDIAGAVDANDIENVIRGILEEAKAEAGMAAELIAGVVVTSPTYDGIVSDIKEIGNIVHRYGIPLIVDQAHGAHFGIHPGYPENAVREGADLVIHSVHKTLAAPTQTALLHKNGNLVDSEFVRKYLRIYQSSSPSYILMGGIDRAVRMAVQEGYQRLDRLLSMRNAFLEEAAHCHWIKICPFTEPGKLVISVKGSFMTGQMLYDILRDKYRLQMEMASGSYVVAILSMMDREEGLKRLSAALSEVDREIHDYQKISGWGSVTGFEEKQKNIKKERITAGLDLRPKIRLNLWGAYTVPNMEMEIGRAEGQVMAEFVNLYPPGIPLLVPGEVLDSAMIEVIESYLKNGYEIQGITENKVKVLKA